MTNTTVDTRFGDLVQSLVLVLFLDWFFRVNASPLELGLMVAVSYTTFRMLDVVYRKVSRARA